MSRGVLVGNGNWHSGYIAKQLGQSGTKATKKRLEAIIEYYMTHTASLRVFNLAVALKNDNEADILKYALQMLEVELYDGLREEQQQAIKDKFEVK